MTIQQKVSQNFMFVLRRYREEKNLTQEVLSERIGVSISFIGMMETGLKRPNIDMLFRIAYALRVSPAELIDALEKESISRGISA